MPNGRVDQVNEPDILRNHAKRLTNLENGDGSFPWINVGTYPTDPGTTPPSPPFTSPWSAVDTDNPPRFKRVLNWLFIEGGAGITGGTTGDEIFVLPAGYFNPLKRYPLMAALDDLTGTFTYSIETDGSVVMGTIFT